jgi:methionyl-tRNA formyltransferase
MRVVFMGSPEFALPSLRRLIESEHEIVGVFTQPDRPVGRGRKLSPPPVKQLALEHDLPVFQPSISKLESVEQMRALAPDVGVIAAYGQILKQPVLDVPRLGVLNVHASLLPRWRGAAPVTAAILAGDDFSGATIMLVRLALDAGPMLASTRVRIEPEDTAGTLTAKIAEAGAELLLDVLPQWAAGSIDAVEQDDAQSTYAPMIEKTDALIRWERDGAETIARQVRAYNPWPMAWSYLDGEPLRIVEARIVESRSDDPPGTIVGTDGGIGVVTGDGDLGVVRVQPAGRGVMSATEFVRGRRDVVGKRLSAAR